MKHHANRGIPRNKKPLQNKVYRVELIQTLTTGSVEDYEQFKFKDQGYIVLKWCHEKSFNRFGVWNWHGFITPADLKAKIGQRQWAKFCQGKRVFVVQRRIDSHNVKL